MVKKNLIHKITSEAFQFVVETFTFKILKRNIYDNIIILSLGQWSCHSKTKTFVFNMFYAD